MRKILIALALLLAPALASAVTVSSTTASTNGTPPLLLQPKESLTYTEAGTFTGRIELQKSKNLINWEPLAISTTNNAGGTFTGVIYNDETPTYYRWKGSTITAGSFVTTLADNDDLVAQFNNLKGVPVLKLHDETIRTDYRINTGGLTIESALGLRWDNVRITTGTTSPGVAGVLAFDTAWTLWVSTGTTATQWVKIGAQ
jgi:hypothetical protein